MPNHREGVEVLQAWFKSVPGDKLLKCIIGPASARTTVHIPSNKLFVWLVAGDQGWIADCRTITTNFTDQLKILLDSPTEDGTKRLTIFHPTNHKDLK